MPAFALLQYRVEISAAQIITKDAAEEREAFNPMTSLCIALLQDLQLDHQTAAFITDIYQIWQIYGWDEKAPHKCNSQFITTF